MSSRLVENGRLGRNLNPESIFVKQTMKKKNKKKMDFLFGRYLAQKSPFAWLVFFLSQVTLLEIKFDIDVFSLISSSFSWEIIMLGHYQFFLKIAIGFLRIKFM